MELELTTDPDRLLALPPTLAAASSRPAARAALAGDRDAVPIPLRSVRHYARDVLGQSA